MGVAQCKSARTVPHMTQWCRRAPPRPSRAGLALTLSRRAAPSKAARWTCQLQTKRGGAMGLRGVKSANRRGQRCVVCGPRLFPPQCRLGAMLPSRIARNLK